MPSEDQRARSEIMVPGPAADAIFRAGYEAGKADAIDRCMIERRVLAKEHNAAIGLCVVAIRALDVRHALQKWISA